MLLCSLRCSCCYRCNSLVKRQCLTIQVAALHTDLLAWLLTMCNVLLLRLLPLLILRSAGTSDGHLQNKSDVSVPHNTSISTPPRKLAGGLAIDMMCCAALLLLLLLSSAGP